MRPHGEPPDEREQHVEKFTISPLKKDNPSLLAEASKLWVTQNPKDVVDPAKRLNFDSALDAGNGMIVLDEDKSAAAVTLVFAYETAEPDGSTLDWYEIGSSVTERSCGSLGLMKVLYGLVNLQGILQADTDQHLRLFAIVHPLQHAADQGRPPSERGAMYHVLDRYLGYRPHSPPEPLYSVRAGTLGDAPSRPPSGGKLWMMPGSTSRDTLAVVARVREIIEPMIVAGRPGVLVDPAGRYEITVDLPWFVEFCRDGGFATLLPHFSTSRVLP